MLSNFYSDSDYMVVMGLGKTGMACVNFLVKHNIPVCVMDNRENPPGLDILKQKYPDIPYIINRFDAEILSQASEIVISPGLSRKEAALAEAHVKGIPIIGEIELFARHVNAPVVAITGSNGKSTVTTLLGEMAIKANWNVKVGGNLGTPAVDLLSTPAPDLYILELSSFQLESIYSLNPQASVILNISEDHMDRYDDDLEEYIAAKQTIYQGDGTIIINSDDHYVDTISLTDRQTLSFSLYDENADFSVCEEYLVHDNKRLLATKKMRLQGSIMRANALAALALGTAVNLPMQAMLDALQTFGGLTHRCSWVANKQGVDFFNDSKGTNVGATIAAIRGLERKSVLIAGGEGKGADFSALKPVVAEHCNACVLIGRDAKIIAEALDNVVPIYYALDMETAVKQAAELGDVVLLSPACASFDMFKNYEHRGEVFEEMVNKLAA
jgi:UDP-N-acetylmuramoylalanine--D-glutamate ligase